MHFVSANATETVGKVERLNVAGTTFYGIVRVNVLYLCRSVCGDIQYFLYDPYLFFCLSK